MQANYDEFVAKESGRAKGRGSKKAGANKNATPIQKPGVRVGTGRAGERESGREPAIVALQSQI